MGWWFFWGGAVRWFCPPSHHFSSSSRDAPARPSLLPLFLSGVWWCFVGRRRVSLGAPKVGSLFSSHVWPMTSFFFFSSTFGFFYSLSPPSPLLSLPHPQSRVSPRLKSWWLLKRKEEERKKKERKKMKERLVGCILSRGSRCNHICTESKVHKNENES